MHCNCLLTRYNLPLNSHPFHDHFSSLLTASQHKIGGTALERSTHEVRSSHVEKETEQFPLLLHAVLGMGQCYHSSVSIDVAVGGPCKSGPYLVQREPQEYTKTSFEARDDR